MAVGKNIELFNCDGNEIFLLHVDTGDCLSVILICEIDMTGMDLSQTEITAPDLTCLLYYNGAEAPEKFARQLREELAT